MNIYLIGVIILTILGGRLLTLFGYSIKTFKSIDLIIFFDKNKINTEKALKMVGNTIVATGLLIFIIGVLGIFLTPAFLGEILLAQILILTLSLLLTTYQLKLFCKR